MTWSLAFIPSAAASGRSWLAVSIIPDLLLVAILILLWRYLLSGRRPPRQELADIRMELTRSVEALWLATELADVGVWSWDLVNGELTWSDRCKTHFGLPVGQSESMELFYSRLHPDDRDRVRTALDRSRNERTELRTTYRARLPDGTQRDIATLGRCTYDVHGKPLSMGGVTLDLSRILRLETDLQTTQAVGERQAAELEMARRFKVVAENASDVVMETDNDGVVRWVTPSVITQIGQQPADVVGTPFAAAVHPDDRDKIHSLAGQVRAGVLATAEVRWRRADGSYRWFSLALRPVLDDRQTIVRRVGCWRDIHAEVLAREAIEIERQRLRAQMASMINPLVLVESIRDPAGRIADFTIADANPPACEFFTLDRDRIQGRRLLELLPLMSTTGLIARFAETADTGRLTVIDDFPLPMPDGSVRWLDLRAARADGRVSLVLRDNTDRQAALERITTSEEQFRLLAENTLDVVLRIDVHDRVIWVSPSVRSVLGWDIADCIGHSCHEFLATEEMRQQYRLDKKRVFVGEGTVSRSQVRSKSGDIHWMETHSSPDRAADGRIVGVIMAMRIIDTEVLAEDALERRARTDDLTLLLNRRELMDRLGGLVAAGTSGFAVLCCDIDRFKKINDTYGHAAGDAVLEALGERIRGSLQSSADLGGRIGGDELMVVLHDVRDLAAAAGAAERLRSSAAEPINFAAGPLAVTLSIGATVAGLGESVDAILARADEAMYQAKELGRNRVVALSPEAAVPSG
jgi:diguanylate cyclase (GGDEF)-like protein/PAS domain S-box-containing protein